MKTYQIVLGIIGILCLNNLALLSFIGHFSETDSTITEVTNDAEKTEFTLDSSSPHSTIDEKIPAALQPEGSPEPEIQTLEETVEDYMRSDQFATILDDWQLKSRQRGSEIKERLAKMNGQELHDVTLDAESRTERVMAFNLLLQDGGSKLKQLSNAQLKGLYTEIDGDHWSKMNMLGLLVEREDTDAINWAKQSISDNSLPKNSSHDIYSAIYENDPDFIKNHLENVEFDTSPTPYALLSFLNQEPDLGGPFLTRNFDKILNSDNDEVFMLGAINSTIEMTQQQQSKIADLFGSTNRHKRNFAIGLARNIKDIQILRDGYEQLALKGDQRQFIVSLLYSGTNTEISRFARELAASSDDPNIQNLANTNLNY